MNGNQVRCPRGHVLTRSELVTCDVGHAHERYVCPMRAGNRRCGEVVVVPAFTAGCDQEEGR